MATIAEVIGRIRDPIEFASIFWPQVEFYDKQREIIYSVRETPETYVVAGNMLGKDFVGGFLALGAFLAPHIFLAPPRGHPLYSPPPPTLSVRIVTTSVKDDHLRVLWGEIGRFIQTSRIPLTVDKGGPLIFNHREVRKLTIPRMGARRFSPDGGNGGAAGRHGMGGGESFSQRTASGGRRSSFDWLEPIPQAVEDEISYLRGMVSKKGEGMAGHHAPYTFALLDEASGLEDLVYEMGVATWCKRILVIGNAWPTVNFFKKGVKDGNMGMDEADGRR